MAEVIGPNSYLPGQSLKPKKNMVCDEHADREATHRVVGETDSFGSEIMYMCDECYQEMQQQIEGQREAPRRCEICKEMKTNVSPMRDPSEGSYGPLYNTCIACAVKIMDDFCEDY